jgi:hypothetical protein
MSQRSPLTIALLFLATLACDLLAVRNLFVTNSINSRAVVVALCISQTNLVVIWAIVGPLSAYQRWLCVALMTLIGALLIWNDWIYRFDESLLIAAGPALAVSMLLWCIKQTRLWRQVAGEDGRLPWQFTLKQLLLVITLLPLALVVIRNRHDLDIWETATLVTGSALLAAGATILECTDLHRVLRIAGLFGAALVIAQVSTNIDSYRIMGNNYHATLETFTAHYLIQALVLETWLALAPIIPCRTAADAPGAE